MQVAHGDTRTLAAPQEAPSVQRERELKRAQAALYVSIWPIKYMAPEQQWQKSSASKKRAIVDLKRKEPT